MQKMHNAKLPFVDQVGVLVCVQCLWGVEGGCGRWVVCVGVLCKCVVCWVCVWVRCLVCVRDVWCMVCVCVCEMSGV